MGVLWGCGLYEDMFFMIRDNEDASFREMQNFWGCEFYKDLWGHEFYEEGVKMDFHLLRLQWCKFHERKAGFAQWGDQVRVCS